MNFHECFAQLFVSIREIRGFRFAALKVPRVIRGLLAPRIHRLEAYATLLRLPFIDFAHSFII